MANFTLDTSRFEAAVAFVLDNTSKNLVEVVNRGALTAIIGGRGVQGAMQRTPRASQQAIMAVPIRFIAASAIKRLKEKQGRFTRKQLYHAIAVEYRRRVGAIGYTAYVGWNKAAMAFGGRGLGKRAASQIGYATKGYGIPAQPSNLTAVMVNAAPAADSIGRQALQDALNDVARDMIDHTYEKLAKVFRETQ